MQCYCEDLRMDHLPYGARGVAELVLQVTRAQSGGGCKAFYSPSEWVKRGEQFGHNSELIVVHDGGDLAPWFNWAYEQDALVACLVSALAEHGLYYESCECWYSAIYRIGR